MKRSSQQPRRHDGAVSLALVALVLATAAAVLGFGAVGLVVAVLGLAALWWYRERLWRSELAAAHDAVERSRLEVEAAGKDRDGLLASMSHELRTPMNGVIGMSELLLRTELSASQRESLDIVHTSARNLLSILDDVLDLARLRSGELELEAVDFDPRELVVQVVRSHAVRADEQRTQLTVCAADDLPAVVQGDPSRLRQILHNLVGNAVKFTASGTVSVRVRRDGDVLHFAVKDSGIGIAKERQQAIFEEYTQAAVSTQREYGGTGLGLPIASRLVRAMGGELALDSAPGEGATFSFSVGFRVASERPPGVRPDLSRRAIALFSPFPTVAEALGDGLRARGAEVSVVPTPRDLVGQRADVVVFDIHGDGGPECFDEAIREGWCHPDEVLLLVGVGAEDELATGRRHGVAGWVSRPVDACGVVRVVWELLEPLQAEESVDQTSTAAVRSRRVLVVDDNPINARVAELMLRSSGHTVAVAADGETALQIVDQQAWDLVFMDVQMPGIDGLEATRRLRVRHPVDALPVVGLTAMVGPDVNETARQAGMNGLLAKPYSQAELLAAVEQWTSDDAVPETVAEVLNQQLLDFLYSAAQRTGQPGLVRDLVNNYERRAGQWLEGMKQLHRTEPEAVGRLAHTLVGVAGGVGALETAMRARDVMIAADEGPIPLVAIRALEGAFDRSLVALRRDESRRDAVPA